MKATIRFETKDQRRDISHLKIVGAHHRHEQWRRTMDPHAVLRRLWDCLERESVPDTLYWSRNDKDDDDANQFCVNAVHYKANIGALQHNGWMPHSAEALMELLFTYDFTIRAEKEDMLHCSNPNFRRGRLDLLKRIQQQQQDLLHPADERQYKALPNTWPQQNNLQQQHQHDDSNSEIDAAWDDEHSDGIDPFQFQNDQLSQIPPPNDNKTMPQIDRSIHTLLKTCWDRAVALQSTTLPVTETPNNTMSQRRTPAMAKDACQRWNLVPSNPFVCPSCHIPTHNEQHWERHYYGTDTTDGCCWMAVAEQRRAFIRTCLAKEVSVQRHLLLQTLLSQEEQQSSLDAFGMLHSLETKLNESRPLTAANVSTLQVSAELPPMVLNPDILESARARVVERYSTVPR